MNQLITLADLNPEHFEVLDGQVTSKQVVSYTDVEINTLRLLNLNNAGVFLYIPYPTEAYVENVASSIKEIPLALLEPAYLSRAFIDVDVNGYVSAPSVEKATRNEIDTYLNFFQGLKGLSVLNRLDLGFVEEPFDAQLEAARGIYMRGAYKNGNVSLENHYNYDLSNATYRFVPVNSKYVNNYSEVIFENGEVYIIRFQGTDYNLIRSNIQLNSVQDSVNISFFVPENDYQSIESYPDKTDLGWMITQNKNREGFLFVCYDFKNNVVVDKFHAYANLQGKMSWHIDFNFGIQPGAEIKLLDKNGADADPYWPTRVSPPSINPKPSKQPGNKKKLV